MLFVRWPIKNFLGHPGNVANQFVQKKSVSLLGNLASGGGPMGGIGCGGGFGWKERGA